MNNESVRLHFDALAEQGVWASLYREADGKITAETWSFLIRARRVVQLLEFSGTKLHELLDIGWGTAPIAESIVAMGAHYTGVDFSPEMVSAAARNVSGLAANGTARVSLGDVTNLRSPDGSFNAVTAMGLIEYLSQREIAQSLSEVGRVSRPGGLAVITIPKRWNWASLWAFCFIL